MLLNYYNIVIINCAYLLEAMIFSVKFRSGFLAIIDGVEIGLSGLFALVIAIIVTVGKKETCDSLEDLLKQFGIRL